MTLEPAHTDFIYLFFLTVRQNTSDLCVFVCMCGQNGVDYLYDKQSRLISSLSSSASRNLS